MTEEHQIVYTSLPEYKAEGVPVPVPEPEPEPEPEPAPEFKEEAASTPYVFLPIQALMF